MLTFFLCLSHHNRLHPTMYLSKWMYEKDLSVCKCACVTDRYKYLNAFVDVQKAVLPLNQTSACSYYCMYPPCTSMSFPLFHHCPSSRLTTWQMDQRQSTHSFLASCRWIHFRSEMLINWNCLSCSHLHWKITREAHEGTRITMHLDSVVAHHWLWL